MSTEAHLWASATCGTDGPGLRRPQCHGLTRRVRDRYSSAQACVEVVLDHVTEARDPGTSPNPGSALCQVSGTGSETGHAGVDPGPWPCQPVTRAARISNSAPERTTAVLAAAVPFSLLERKHEYLRFGLFVGLISSL